MSISEKRKNELIAELHLHDGRHPTAAEVKRILEANFESPYDALNSIATDLTEQSNEERTKHLAERTEKAKADYLKGHPFGEEEEEFVSNCNGNAWMKSLRHYKSIETHLRAEADNPELDDLEKSDLLKQADDAKADAQTAHNHVVDYWPHMEGEAQALLEQSHPEPLGDISKSDFEKELSTRPDSWREAFKYNLLCQHFKQEGERYHAKKAREALTLKDPKAKQYRDMLMDSTKADGWAAFRTFYRTYQNSPEAEDVIQNYTGT